VKLCPGHEAPDQEAWLHTNEALTNRVEFQVGQEVDSSSSNIERCDVILAAGTTVAADLEPGLQGSI
jgi:hypothetical protein